MRIISFLSLLLFTSAVSGQVAAPAKAERNVASSTHLGLGMGMDHGGIGVRLDVPLSRNLAAVGGLGYAVVGMGWNVGLQLRTDPTKPVGLYMTALYGYNGAIKVEGAGRYDKLYYGFTPGAGVEFRGARGNFFHMALLVPLRSPEFWGDWDDLKAEGVQVKQGPLPVAVSLGYHFAL
jgi:hypothetical protein